MPSKEKIVLNSFLNWRGEKRGLFVLGIFFFLNAADVWSQIENDTTGIQFSVEKSPRVAVIRSALVPGWGQWYNGQKLKALLVLGGELALAGNAILYNQWAVKSSTKMEREFYQYNRSRFLWWFFGVYLLNILDAYVDAHLWNFDTGPDLSSLWVMGEEKVLVTLRIGIFRKDRKQD